MEGLWPTLIQGDCRDVLKTLESESVHCCVTSPPYWGLRDYGTATWDGGEPECDHLMPLGGGTQASGLWTGNSQEAIERKVEVRRQQFRDPCGKCGARRIDNQIGLEPTPELHIEALLAVFREVWRVLRKDGTLWLNYGDCYDAGTRSTRDYSKTTKHGYWNNPAIDKRISAGLKAKDLVGMPWRLAFALQAEGWYLRSDIIWAKPNPMPESVTDRPTRSHEYLFLLTKSATYFYDADAIREPVSSESLARNGRHGSTGGNPYRDDSGNFCGTDPAGRNRRTVWEIATQPTPEAHFATFPEALVEPCILAGCPEGGTVLDPFAGSGTVMRVASRLARRSIGIELSAEYVETIARKRTAQGSLGL